MKTKLMALAALKKYSLPFSDENQARYEFGNSSVDSELSRRAAISALETDISKPVDPYGWQVQGLRDTFKGDHAEMDSKAEAARIGGTAYAFPIYTTPQEPAAKPFDDSALYRAAISCGHVIEHHSITLERDETKPGNALNQLQKRLNQAALEMALQEPVAPGCAGMIAVNKELLEALREIVGQHGQWNNSIWAANIASTAIAKATRATP